ncbi:hypothetical protein ANN_01121 [Periplaneta americana]|uniref:Uncharacterized protein n=1 Tax=Periplaneta americana TaxID=6978 RepID=A0ABQ8TVL1_PERAM|nr:hypothetical protein ANN_01121 [Periplaneta americana]
MPCPSQTSGFNVPNYVRDVLTAVKRWFRSQAADFYDTRIQKLIPWYDKCLNSKTWTLRRNEENRLEALEMWIWRRMERVKWTDRIRNEAVLERVGEEKIMLKLIRKRKKELVGSLAEKKLPTEGCTRRNVKTGTTTNATQLCEKSSEVGLQMDPEKTKLVTNADNILTTINNMMLEYVAEATEKSASCVPESPTAETARQDKEHRHPNKKRYAGCSDAGATSQMEMGRTQRVKWRGRIRHEVVLERVGKERMMLKHQKEKKELVESLSEKKLPSEGCTGINGEGREEFGVEEDIR